MRKATKQFETMFIIGEVGDKIDIYTSLEELLAFSNVNKREVIRIWNNFSNDKDVVGFAKIDNFTEENPRFIQVYSDEVEFID